MAPPDRRVALIVTRGRGPMRAMLRAVLVLASLLALAGGADTPVPAYPFPEQPNLEETEFYELVAGDEEAEEEDDWVYEEDETDGAVGGVVADPEGPAPER